MGTLRCDCYQDFAKQIEYPLIAWKALTGEIIIMNYEAKLIIGQKPEQLSVTMDMVADEKKFWSTLHDRKAIVEHHLILHTGHRDIPVAGLVNEFDIEGEIAYMLLFEQRTGFEQNSWLLERIIENSPVVALHISFNGEDEIKLNYISKNIKRYGYTCEQFYSGQLQYKDIIHPDDFEIISEKFRAHINDGALNDSMEYRIVTESRKISYVRSLVCFTRDEQGRINGMESLMLDIMDEKLNKDENQYLRSAIEQSHNVVIIKRYFNQKSVVKYVSSNAESLGMDVEGLRSGRKLFEDYILPEDRRILAEALVNVHKEKGKHVTGQCRIRNEEGQLRWISFEILVDNLDEYMYDIELILTDATGLKKYEQNLLQNQKDLEEKLDYVMSGSLQATERKLEDFIATEEVQGFLKAYAENSQLYAVLIDTHLKQLTVPEGPMIRLGEFYDLLENPKYREKLREAVTLTEEKQKFCILQTEEGNFDKQLGAVPLVIHGDIVAVCLLCAFDEEAVARLHNSIESLQKLIEIITKAGADNKYIEMDSRRSRLAEKTMSEELEGQLILARAFAHMRSDGDATIQEIIEQSCKLLHISSIVIYAGDRMQEAYTCIAKYTAEDALFHDYPDQSWRMAELCRKNEVLAHGGYISSLNPANAAQLEYLMTRTQSRAMMIHGLMINDEVYGAVLFTSTHPRQRMREREISYCRDMVEIIQGILERNRSRNHVNVLNQDLLNAYNYMSEYVFVRDTQTGVVLFANEAMENLFGYDVTGTDSRAFLSTPTPTYTREGVQPVGNIKWQSFIRSVNKIMNIQELVIEWQNGEEAKLVIMRENIKNS